MAEYQRRREKQPLTLPSAGSTFKRPEAILPGALIQQAGLMGLRVGERRFHPARASWSTTRRHRPGY